MKSSKHISIILSLSAFSTMIETLLLDLKRRKFGQSTVLEREEMEDLSRYFVKRDNFV